jgi:ketosteroid isomerase-like protein
MSLTARQVVQRYLDAFGGGDMDSVRDSLAHDATWTIYGTLDHLPPDGTWTGRDRIVDDFLGHWGPRLFQPGTINMELVSITAEGDTVAVEWRITALCANGAEYDNAYCGIFSVRAGKIQAIREYLDSGYAARTLFP